MGMSCAVRGISDFVRGLCIIWWLSTLSRLDNRSKIERHLQACPRVSVNITRWPRQRENRGCCVVGWFNQYRVSDCLNHNYMSCLADTMVCIANEFRKYHLYSKGFEEAFVQCTHKCLALFSCCDNSKMVFPIVFIDKGVCKSFCTVHACWQLWYCFGSKEM